MKTHYSIIQISVENIIRVGFNLNKIMKLIFILLSLFSFNYGVIFAPVQSKIIKYLGRLLFVNYLILEIYNGINRNSKDYTFVDWIGYESYVIGCIIYGFLMIKNGDKIVNYVISNIDFLNRFQYKVTCFAIIICFVIYTLGIAMSCKDYLTDAEFVFVGQTRYAAIFNAIASPYNYWVVISSIIYSLMYFEMHLKHTKFLDRMKQDKIRSHILVYKISIQVQNDYENFENLVSILPALWMTTFLLGMNANITYARGIRFDIIIFTSFFMSVIAWFPVYFFVNYCKSSLRTKIKYIEYDFLFDESIDEQKVYRFLDRLTDIHVTVFHLLTFDKGIFLPYVGSVLSYTFLFLQFV